jgi:hypothetical protein
MTLTLEEVEALIEAAQSGLLYSLREANMDPNVGGGVDRSKIPAEDFAGKNRSFPIVTPQDVADAARSIGRAGADNYAPEQLRVNIIRIAKRKGASFVAKLPASWQPAKEAADDPDLVDEAAIFEGDIVDLIEKAVAADDTINVKIISPGWGASGFYPAEVLKRDGAKAFPKGTLMHLDHPTAEESKQRPERSVKDLAAALSEDPVYQENHPQGPGLYGKAAVIPGYRKFIDAAAPFIGVSIRSYGKSEEGEAEGKKGVIIKELVHHPVHNTVDFVTKAGRGGQVLALMESYRPSGDPAGTNQEPDVTQEAATMTDEEIKKLQADLAASEAEIVKIKAENEVLKDDNRVLREAQVLVEAGKIVAAELAKVDLPQISKDRLQETLVKAAKLTGEGKLDATALTESIATTVASESDYVTKLHGVGSGEVRDMGRSTPELDKKLEESYFEGYKREGYDDDTARKMAKTAAR